MKTLKKLIKNFLINFAPKLTFEDFGCLNFNLPPLNKFKRILWKINIKQKKLPLVDV